jgi:hypothetical protein
MAGVLIRDADYFCQWFMALNERVLLQELVEVVNRSTGVVLMAPPDDSAEARASIATLLSALKPKQKVRPSHAPLFPLHASNVSV